MDPVANKILKAIVAKKYKAVENNVQRCDVDIIDNAGRHEGYRNGACFASLPSTVANRKRGTATHIVYMPVKQCFEWHPEGDIIGWLTGCHAAGMLRPYTGPPEDIYYKKEIVIPLQSYDASYDRIYIALSSVRYMAEYGDVVRQTVKLHRTGVPFLLSFFICHSALMIGSGHSFLNVTGGGYGNRNSCHDLAYYIRLRDYLGRRGKWSVTGRNLAPLVNQESGYFRASGLLDIECQAGDALNLNTYENMLTDKAIIASKAETIEEARVLIG